MVMKRRLLALVLVGTGVAFAACSLITDVDRSKIEGSGGAGEIGGAHADSGMSTGGQMATGGQSSVDGGNHSDASVPNAGEEPQY